jgi:hypothetical protein
VEGVLEAVVAPLAAERPVLLLVLDGMSAPVFHELLEDFAQREWVPIAKGGQNYARPVLAALPSVTDISRRALFSGRLDCADRRTEQVAFRDHPVLTHLGTKDKPQLFLKGDLANSGEFFLSDSVREAIASPAQRVVGVLLNVVDDQLGGADQLEVRWRIPQIRFLEAILEAASQAERLILLTSDHGHIPDLNQTGKAIESTNGGDRYRYPGGKPVGSGELLVQGPRIRAATDKDLVIVACEETVRYSSKKAGYHGGGADLEVVIPLAVLDSQDHTVKDWVAQDPATPDWWRWMTFLGSIDEESCRPIQKRSRTRAKKEDAAQDSLPLFGAEPPTISQAAPSMSWIKQLLASPVFKQQAAIVGKLVPKEEQITAFLTAMDKRGNSVLIVTLATDLGIPSFRLRGLISSLARLFNVDGYAVLQEDRVSNTITLDRKLLSKQFELSA